MRVRDFLCLAVAVALLAFAALPVPATAEEIPGSGCDPGLYYPFCVVDQGPASIVCGAQVGSGFEKAWVTDVRVAAHDLATDKETYHCVTGKYCELQIPESTWFVLELEVPCGNGKMFWRNVSRLSGGKFEQKPYSPAVLEEFQVLNDQTLLAMAEFNLLASANTPYPVSPPAPKK